MIYHFAIINDKGISKDFYFTAASEMDLYRRIRDTYRVENDRVNIMEMFEETEDYGYEPVPLTHGEKKIDKKTQKYLDKANEIFGKAKKKTGNKKKDYMEKYGFSEILIDGVKDLPDILKKYKKVKVYFQPGEKRGTKQYYALAK